METTLTSPPTKVRWLVFSLGCGISFTLYLHRYTFALIKPDLQKSGYSVEELGFLDSAFSAAYMVFQFPAGVLADVMGAHLFLSGTMLIWSLALAMHAWAPTAALLVAARSIFGIAQAAALAAINRVARTWFPSSIRTTVQGWMGIFCVRAGGASANVLFASVLMGVFLLSWQSAIYIFAAVGVVLAILFLVLFRDSPRRHPWVNEAEANLIDDVRPGTSNVPSPRLTVREMFARMSPRSLGNLACLNLQSTLSTMADNIYSSWMPLFLKNVHELDNVEMGVYSALPLVGGAIGGAFGGYLNDALIRRTGNRRRVRSGVGFAGKAIGGVLLLVAVGFFFNEPYIFCGMLFFVKFFGDWSLTTAWGTSTDIGGKATASVFAFNNSVASIGFVLAPLMYGFIAQHYHWRPVFIVGAVVSLLCAFSWLLIDCTIPIVRERD